MSKDFKKYYEEYKQIFIKKKISSESNSNRVSGKDENIQTSKNIKSTKKENIHNNDVIPFGYENINNNINERINLENKINMIDRKSYYFKNRKLYIPKKNIFIGKKEFYKKNGKSENFNLFEEKEIGLNIFNIKTNIMSSEEDYDSDEMIIMDGKKKAEEDLIEAVENIKKNSFKDINNYQKYYSKIK